jgi:muramoyltetrapeptide carboxypeptidase
LTRPHALRPGDTVGLITPSSYTSDPDELEFAARVVRFFDLRLKTGKNVGQRAGYLAGSVAQRVSDLHDMFRDPDVKAIFAVRGGYGAAQLLDRIDYDLIRANPKIFLGYSDITALHLAMQKRAGLVTFHGPVATSHLSAWSQNGLRKALFETQPIGLVTNPPDSNALRPGHTMRTVRSGKARGRLAGGNLTLISTTLGTPFEIETRGRILLLEDIEEDIYRIDRMLTHLRLAGKLDGVAGIVFAARHGYYSHRPRLGKRTGQHSRGLLRYADSAESACEFACTGAQLDHRPAMGCVADRRYRKIYT